METIVSFDAIAAVVTTTPVAVVVTLSTARVAEATPTGVVIAEATAAKDAISVWIERTFGPTARM